jgi:hypothetical protein
MVPIKRMSASERDLVLRMFHQQGQTPNQIALALGRHVSSICRLLQKKKQHQKIGRKKAAPIPSGCPLLCVTGAVSTECLPGPFREEAQVCQADHRATSREGQGSEGGHPGHDTPPGEVRRWKGQVLLEDPSKGSPQGRSSLQAATGEV